MEVSVDHKSCWVPLFKIGFRSLRGPLLASVEDRLPRSMCVSLSVAICRGSRAVHRAGQGSGHGHGAVSQFSRPGAAQPREGHCCRRSMHSKGEKQN